MEEPLQDYNPDLDIIEYLTKQEIEGELDIQNYLEQEREFHKADVRYILNCIVNKIENRAKNRQDHEAKIKAHNQYPLFDLSKVIEEAFIDDDMYDRMIFRESLIISKVNHDNTLTSVGGLSLDIQSAKGSQSLQRKFTEDNVKECLEIPNDDVYWADKRHKQDSLSTLEQNDDELKAYATEVKRKLHRTFNKFLVHLHSQLDVNGHNGGSKMTSWIDRNLHTLEEKRKEYIIEENQNLKEKSLYVAMQKGKYYVKHKSRPDNTRDKKFYSFAKTKHYISEGANFLLMRYLAIFRHFGIFEMSTMYINGDMCRSIYVCNGPEGGIINGNKVDLCRIYRVIIEECGIEHKSHTLLTLCGQIIKHEWEDCDYVLHVNPRATIKNEKPIWSDNHPLQNTWQEDMQLFSMYLDEKNTTSMLVRSYLLDHPELNSIIADYIQHILTLKPQDILEFTINHFKNFAPHYFPKNDYYENTYVEEEEMFTI